MRNFIKLILTYLVITLLSVMTYNFSVDKVGVFWRGSAWGSYEPNQRYLKTKFLVENKSKFKVLLTGNSRPGFINIANHIDSSYNFCYSACVPAEILKDLKFLYNNGLKLDTLIMAVDNISFMVDSRIHDTQPLRFGFTNHKQKLKMLFYPPRVLSDLKSILSVKTKKYFITKDGSKLVLKEPNPQNVNWDLPSSGIYYSEAINSSINFIEQIKDLCDINNTELIIFVNPLYKSTLMNFEKEIEIFTDKLIDYNVYNFCHLNSMTMTKENYYETSHYRPFIGDILMEIILNGDTTSCYLKKPTNISADWF